MSGTALTVTVPGGDAALRLPAEDLAAVAAHGAALDLCLDVEGRFSAVGALVPADACRAVIAEIDALAPLSAAKASELMWRIGSAIPHRPETLRSKARGDEGDLRSRQYAKTAIEVLQGYPAAVAAAAVGAVERTSKWLPAVAEIAAVADAIHADLRRKRLIAQRTLEVHARRQAEAHERAVREAGRNDPARPPRLAALREALTARAAERADGAEEAGRVGTDGPKRPRRPPIPAAVLADLEKRKRGEAAPAPHRSATTAGESA